jgi:protein-disulfide isomerase
MTRRLFASLSLFAVLAGGPLHAQEPAVGNARGATAETMANDKSNAQVMLLSAFDAAVKQVLIANPDLLDNAIRDYLMAHPEVILQSVGAAQQRQQIVQQELAKQTIVDNREKLFADPNATVIGNPDGEKVLVEFFDYQCGYCKSVHPDVNKLIDSDPGVRMVMKEFPILGPASVVASKAALAARAQGKYLELHNALMANHGQLDDATIMRLASSVGLDVNRLRRDMESANVQRIIADNQALAATLGIRGTPAFVSPTKLAPGAIPLVEMQRMLSGEQG